MIDNERLPVSKEYFCGLFEKKTNDNAFSNRYAGLFYQYYYLLVSENEKINLTAITEPGEVIEKHFLDSLQPFFLGLIPENSSVADVGSGAGFPGIPLAILLPQCRFTLIEPIKKRVDFLYSVISALELDNCEILALRSEDASKTLRESFDIVCSRAVSRLNVISEYCLPLVKIGGKMLALKGPSVQKEIDEAANAIKLLGGEKPEIILCDTDNSRNIVSVSKISLTPDKYPRRVGIPEKRPLL